MDGWRHCEAGATAADGTHRGTIFQLGICHVAPTVNGWRAKVVVGQTKRRERVDMNVPRNSPAIALSAISPPEGGLSRETGKAEDIGNRLTDGAVARWPYERAGGAQWVRERHFCALSPHRPLFSALTQSNYGRLSHAHANCEISKRL